MAHLPQKVRKSGHKGSSVSNNGLGVMEFGIIKFAGIKNALLILQTYTL
jgi:hypothetical protein